MAATVTAWAVASRTAPSSPAITIAIASARTALAPAFRTRYARLDRRYHSVHAVEVRLVIGIELRAAFDHRRGRALRHCNCRRSWL